MRGSRQQQRRLRAAGPAAAETWSGQRWPQPATRGSVRTHTHDQHDDTERLSAVIAANQSETMTRTNFKAFNTTKRLL